MSNDQVPGELLKSIRERLGISKEKLAIVIGVTSPSIDRWEKGHRVPSPQMMRNIEELAKKIGLGSETQDDKSADSFK